MKRLPLYKRGEVVAYALVDDADFEFLSKWRWRLHGDGYAITGRGPLLHRLLMGLEVGDPREVDHRDRNRLNCQRSNLRVITSAGNRQNVPAYRGGSSRFRGVSFYRGRWYTELQVGGVRERLGGFDDELEAALAVDRRRREVMPSAEPDPELERELDLLRSVV